MHEPLEFPKISVVDVAASGNHVQRQPTAVADQVVLGARAAPVDRRGPDPGAPLLTRRWAASATAQDQSIAPAALSSAGSSRCNRLNTPASFQRLAAAGRSCRSRTP